MDNRSVFIGVDRYINEAYSKQNKVTPKIRGCSRNNKLT